MKTFVVQQTGSVDFTIEADRFETTVSEGIAIATFYKNGPKKRGQSWTDDETIALVYGVTSIRIQPGDYLMLRDFWPFKRHYTEGYLEGMLCGYTQGKIDGQESRDAPCILDENDVEYVVVQKTWAQYIIRPVSQLILRNDGPDGEFVEHLVDPSTHAELPSTHAELPFEASEYFGTGAMEPPALGLVLGPPGHARAFGWMTRHAGE